MKRTLLAAALLAAMVHPAAAAVTITTVADDNALRSLLGGATEPLLDWVSEGRIGNNALNGDFEIDSGLSTGGPFGPGQTAQFVWPNGDARNLTLVYDAGTGRAVFEIGGSEALGDGTQVVFDVPAGRRDFSDLFVRARAPSAATETLFEDFTVDGLNLGSFSSAADGSGLSIRQISGLGLADGFTLTASVSFDWRGAPQPSGSQQAFQLKFANPVPEPGTWALMAAGVLLLGVVGRRTR
jgi:opacity protein-like surface antigen